MSDTPTQDPQETPDETPDEPSTPEAPVEPQDPYLEDEKDMAAAPWYRRPVPIVLLIVLVLLLAVLIPPVVANEVPVGLDEEGQQNVEAGGWEEEEGNEPTTALAGLVFVEPKTLLRENNGIRDAAYIYTTVKIPAMLPQGFVTDQLRENALERLTERGVDVDFDSHTGQSYDDNGHDTLIDYYTGVAEEDGILLNGTTLDLFIATWRCSVLGSYAVAVGVAAQHDEDGNAQTAEAQGHEIAELARLREIQDDLLAHTKCEG